MSHGWLVANQYCSKMLYIEKHVGILNQPMDRILEKFVAQQMLYIDGKSWLQIQYYCYPGFPIDI